MTLGTHAVELNYRTYGEVRADQAPLLFLHGLFGSATNWHSIAGALQDQHFIVTVDLRNHGRSPHAEDASYPAMVSDVVELLGRLGLEQVVAIGHSMGGKVAMQLALRQPALVERLVVVDMAPVRYPNRFESIMAAMRAVPLHDLERRDEADRLLSATVSEPGVRGYLLQNLVRNSAGGFAWRVNLEALNAGIEQIMDFPLSDAETQFPGSCLFVYGDRSDYVTAEYEPRIRALFPYAGLKAIIGAGHWVYAEKPAAFVKALQRFLA